MQIPQHTLPIVVIMIFNGTVIIAEKFWSSHSHRKLPMLTIVMAKENAKTFRKERTYLIYGIILFFILINLFFLPKSTHNAELATSAHSTTPIIPIQPDKPTTNNNIPEGTETKPITTIPEEKKEDKPPVVEKPKEEAENKETKQEEKKSESNKDNTEKADNKSQEKTAEKPNEETKVVPPPTEVKEEPKPQNDNANNNKPSRYHNSQ